MKSKPKPKPRAATRTETVAATPAGRAAPQSPAGPAGSLHYRPIEKLVGRHWTASDVEANGLRQRVYRTGGREAPVLLLHGFMEAGLTWLRVAKALEGEHDVVMPDARAHGRSGGWEGGFGPELLAEDVVALIRALRLERPVLVGRSNGAVTAALVAAAHPDLIRAVVLEDPPAGAAPRPNVPPPSPPSSPSASGPPAASAPPATPESPSASGRGSAPGSPRGRAPAPAQGVATPAGGARPQNWFQAWLQWMRRLERMPHEERIASAAARWPYGMPVPADEPLWPEEDFVPFVEALAQFDTGIFDKKIGYWSLVPYLDRARGIACPVLLVAGEPERGSLVPDDVADALTAAWPAGRAVRVAGAGHTVSRGRTAERFVDLLRPFLLSARRAG